MSASAIDADLLRAYQQTHYRVYADKPFVLQLERSNAALAALHAAHGVSCSAYLSACNPFSLALTYADNDQRHHALGQRLALDRWTYLAGEGVDPSGLWPAEPSYLVLGMDLETARALAHSLQQNALLWSGANAVPALVLLR